MTKGIDISYHNGIIEWDEVKDSGIDFVIIRAGYGLSTVDKQFDNNIRGALAVGLNVGFYWFLYAFNEAEAIKNAQMFHNTIKDYKDKITHKVWCDWEYDSDRYNRDYGISFDKATRTKVVKAFCEKMKEYGYDVGVYANPDYLKNYFNDVSEYPLWLAYYSNSKGSFDPFMWQYTSKGSIAGIKGNVDINECYWEQKSLPYIGGYVGNSIAKALQTYGYKSTFSYRKSLWKELGKTETYKGTAEQNLEMIRLLGGTVVGDIPCLAGYQGFSIVNALEKFGYKSDFEYRKELWKKVGKTSTYKGTALQNLELLNILKSN